MFHMESHSRNTVIIIIIINVITYQFDLQLERCYQVKSKTTLNIKRM